MSSERTGQSWPPLSPVRLLFSAPSLASLSPLSPIDVQSNAQEIQRGFFPEMNSTTRADLHRELSLLQSAMQIVLVKLSLLNGAMRKSGASVENPMALMDESYDVARCHLARLHYEKKQRFLQHRISECNSRLEQMLASERGAGNEGLAVSVEQGEDEVNVEELLAQAQEILGQRQPPRQPHGGEERPPQPPPPPPRTEESFLSPVLTRQWSSSSSPPTPRHHRLPTPVPSPAPGPRHRAASVESKRDRSERERALWPSDDEKDRDDQDENRGEQVSSPPRPLSLPLPHRLLPSASDRPERRASLVAKQQKLFLWRREMDSRLEAAYQTMKRIVPRGIPPFLSGGAGADVGGGSVVSDAQTTQFCYHFGFETALGKRILQKRCLWLISFSAAELARVTPSDLDDGGAYALKGQALDLTELSALYYRLDPLLSESTAGEGPRQEAALMGGSGAEDREEIVHRLRKKLKHLLTLEESGTLPESLRRHPAYGAEQLQTEPMPRPTLSPQSPERRPGSLRFEEI
jgi:hypothetical protein